MRSYIEDHHTWSRHALGAADRREGITKHVELEVKELRASGYDLTEWVDIIILGIDGALQCAGPEEVAKALEIKQKLNIARLWPEVPADQAREHDRADLLGRF